MNINANAASIMFWKVKMSLAFKGPWYTNNIYWFKVGWWRRWVYWKRAQSAMTRKRLRAKYVQWVGPVILFPQKPTPDKYSASDRLKGESPTPGPGSHTHICKHLQIPPDETKDSSSRFPWERLDEATFQPNKVSTVGEKKKPKEGNILMSYKEHFLPRAAFTKSVGPLRGWNTKQCLNGER